MSNLSFRHFEYFISTYEAGSQQKAATELFVSRQTISNAIHEIELEIGHDLFVKKSSPLEPTPIGTNLYTKVKKLLNELEALIQESKSYDKLNFSLAVNINLLSVLPRLKAAFLEYVSSHNNMLINTMETTTQDEIINAIIQKKLDCGIVLSQGLPNSLWACTLRKIPVCAIFHKDHLLASQDSLTLKQILEYPILCFARPEHCYASILNATRKPAQKLTLIVEPNILQASQHMIFNKNVLMLSTNVNTWIPDYPHLRISPVKDAFWTVSLISTADHPLLPIYEDLAEDLIQKLDNSD